jgi:alkylation response protein AidB-like acyl-CoA dehydrogenase
MDFMTASVLLPSPSGNGHKELALATIPADAPGIKVNPCVDRWVLGGSETNEVVLTGVEVPNEYISYFGNAEELNSAISKAFLIFELFVSACYLGVASALVERVLVGKKGTAVERLSLVTEVEGAMTALEGNAQTIMQGQDDPAAVAKSLFVRYFVQHAIERASTRATELLGGMAFMGSGEAACLYAAARALAFHPPSRVSIAPALDNYLMGQPLIMP